MWFEGRLLQRGKPGSVVMKDPMALCRRVLGIGRGVQPMVSLGDWAVMTLRSSSGFQET